MIELKTGVGVEMTRDGQRVSREETYHRGLIAAGRAVLREIESRKRCGAKPRSLSALELRAVNEARAAGDLR